MLMRMIGGFLLVIMTAAVAPVQVGLTAEGQEKKQTAPEGSIEKSTSSAESASQQAAPMAAKTPAAAPAAAPAKPKSPEEEVRAQLNGTKWLIDLTPISTEGKVKPAKDAVKFDLTKIGSEYLVKQGYPQSNYTLTIGEDGTAVWETMQTKEGEGVAFWRGEFHGELMRGVLSKHPLKGDPEDFSFSGREAGGKTIGTSELAPPAAVQPASSTPAPATQQSKPPKKKMRGH